MLRRRPRLEPSAHRALRATMEALERGKDALTEAVPGPRRAGVPLADALLAFEDALEEARRWMPGWRVPEAERAWLASREAIDEAAAMAERLRLEAPTLDFESLVLVLRELIGSLDAASEAERRLAGGPRRPLPRSR